MDIKNYFPIFKNNPRLTLLDSGATAQKPQLVIDEERNFNENYYGSVGRGNCSISVRATQMFETAKEKIASFIGVSAGSIAFVAGATEGLNIIASGIRSKLKPGDEVLISILEHNSNVLPWMRLREEIGIKLKFIKLNANQEITLKDIESEITKNTKIISLTHVSNVSGQLLPIKEVGEIAKKKGIYFFVDGCQSVPHMKIDLSQMYISGFVFSAHKLGGPTGIGVLYLNSDVIDIIDPINLGGGIVLKVYEEKFELIKTMQKFEAGTQNLSGVIAFSKACEFMGKVGYNTLLKNKKSLINYALEKLSKIKALKIIGPKDDEEKRSSLISFYFDDIHPHDVSHILAEKNVCVRSGFHCSDLVHKSLGISGSTRVSFWVYNNRGDIDRLVEALGEVVKALG